MTDNFDPILKSADAPIPVEAGAVLVGSGRRGAVAFKDGSTPTYGERLFGGYKQYHLVTIADRTIEDAFDVQSSQITYKFKVTIRFRVKVIDAAQVVTRGIRDLRDLVSPDLQRAAASVARTFPVTKSLEALAAVQAAVDDYAGNKSDPAVQVRIIDVGLTPDQAAKTMLATLDQEDLEINARQSKAKVDAAQRSIEGQIVSSPSELLTQWLATRDDRYKRLLEEQMQREASSYDRLLQFAQVLQAAGQLEAFDFYEKFPDLGPQILTALGVMMKPGAPDPKRLGELAAPDPDKADESKPPAADKASDE